jgi:hypothetical protein
VSILKRKTADAATLKRARELYKDLFSQCRPEDEDGLVAATRTRLGRWQSDLKSYAHTAATPHHPGKAVIDSALARIGQQLAMADSYEFIEACSSAKDDWLDLSDDIHDLVNFYKTQITAWRKLLEALERFAQPRSPRQGAQGRRGTGRADPDPRQPEALGGQVSRIEPLIATVDHGQRALAQASAKKPCCPSTPRSPRCKPARCHRRHA